MATFLSTLLLALTDANAKWNTGGWTSPFIVGCLVIASLALIVFLVTEFTVKHPLIEISLFKDYNFTVANGILFLFGFGMFGSTFLLPLYLQNSLGYTAFQAGSLFLPVGLIQAIMAPTAGFISDKISPKIPSVIGLTLLAFSLFLNSSLSLFSEHHQVMIPLLIRGLGMGLIFTPLTSMALSNVPRQKTGQASGLYNIIRQLGGSFGIAFMSSLLTRRALYHTAMYSQAVNSQSVPFQQVVGHLSQFSSHALAGNGGLAAMRAQALIAQHIGTQAFVKAVGDVFLVASGITLLGVIPILTLKYKKKPHAGAPKHVALD
jgi:MFS transporter, DHA2 family, multidrug resistance protein